MLSYSKCIEKRKEASDKECRIMMASKVCREMVNKRDLQVDEDIRMQVSNEFRPVEFGSIILWTFLFFYFSIRDFFFFFFNVC